MKKKAFMILALTLILTNGIFAQQIQYWKMDVFIDNFNRSGKPATQTVYFFKDLKSMGDLTGFPQGDNQTRYNWVHPLSGIPSYFYQIYATMRNENFNAAFILYGTGTNIHGQPYWLYHVFLLWNDVEYHDIVGRTNRPVRF